MPTVIRKSDGRVFDVYGLMKLDLRGEFVFLVWDMGRWQWAGVSEFEPTHLHHAVGCVQERDFAHLDYDPDLEAQ